MTIFPSLPEDQLIVIDGEQAFFHHAFVEASIDKIIELKSAKVFKDYFDYLIDLVSYVEEKTQVFLDAEMPNEEVKREQTLIKEITLQGKLISCELSSFLSRLYNELGRTFLNAEKPAEAAQSFEKALYYSPNNITSLYNKADLAFSSYKFEEAIEICEQILALDANYVAAVYLIGLSLSSSGEPAKAVEYFQKTVELDPDSLGGNYWSGECLLHEQKHEEALPYFRKSYALSNNKHKESGRGLAICELFAGSAENAIEICDTIIQSEEGHQVLALQVKGDALIALDRVEEGAYIHREIAIIELDARDFVVNRAHKIAKEYGKEKASRYAAVILDELPEMSEQFAFLVEAHSLQSYEDVK